MGRAPQAPVGRGDYTVLMTKPTIALAALLVGAAAFARAEPPTLEPLRRAAAGEVATVVDGTLIRDGVVRNDNTVRGALTTPEAAPMRVGGPVDLSAPRPIVAPPAPRPQKEGFMSGMLDSPAAMAGAGALVGGVIGFFVGGGLLGAVAGAAIGALLGWGLSKLFGGKNG